MATEKQETKNENPMKKRKLMTGVVVSDKMEKTAVVKINRQVKHPLYKKYLVRSRKFKIHDENNDARVGDLVSVVDFRPVSKHKRWALHSVIRRSAQSAKVKVSGEEKGAS